MTKGMAGLCTSLPRTESPYTAHLHIRLAASEVAFPPMSRPWQNPLRATSECRSASCRKLSARGWVLISAGFRLNWNAAFSCSTEEIEVSERYFVG